MHLFFERSTYLSLCSNFLFPVGRSPFPRYPAVEYTIGVYSDIGPVDKADILETMCFEGSWVFESFPFKNDSHTHLYVVERNQ